MLQREKQCKLTQGSAVSMECGVQKRVVWEIGRLTRVEGVCRWRCVLDGKEANRV